MAGGRPLQPIMELAAGNPSGHGAYGGRKRRGQPSDEVSICKSRAPTNSCEPPTCQSSSSHLRKRLYPSRPSRGQGHQMLFVRYIPGDIKDGRNSTRTSWWSCLLLVLVALVPGGQFACTNGGQLDAPAESSSAISLKVNPSSAGDSLSYDSSDTKLRLRRSSVPGDIAASSTIPQSSLTSAPRSIQLATVISVAPKAVETQISGPPIHDLMNAVATSPEASDMVAAASKKKKKMMKKKKKMEKKHKEWKKGKKHKKKKYESKKKKGGMMKKKKGKKEKKKWGMEKKGHKKKGNFKKKKWGHKKKMKKGHKKGKKGHKMLKDKGHKKKGFKKVYHKEEWGKKKKWHDIKREKKWNTKQKKWKKKWHQEKGKKYKGKHMKKYHKKNKHGKKYKKEKKSKWKKHKGEKFKKGHKKKKEEYSKKKEGGKKKKMKKMMKKKKKG